MCQDVWAIRKSIDNFAYEHRRRPFGVLREVGVQAALKRLIDVELGLRSSAPAFVQDHPEALIPLPLVETDRVRMEAKIELPNANASDELSSRTDVIIYREGGIILTRHGGGPGDIVYHTPAASVLAAIEIKACPSHTPALRAGFARDIARLMLLRAHHIRCFFVALDKSAPLYGDHPVPQDRLDWTPALAAPVSLETIVGVANPEWENILVEARPPEGADYVEIWNVSATNPWERQYYAYRRPASD